jgi:hypothetical protein
MAQIDADFLKYLFREINAHIRATDQKSLSVTGAYMGLFSVYLTTVAIGRWEVSQVSPWVEVAIQVFFLCVGTCIYVMQQWYRAWKEHYIDVCLNIRKYFMPDAEDIAILPYWLRHGPVESRMSIDNVLKYLTAMMNFVLVFIILYRVLTLVRDRNLGILTIALLILGYVGVIYAADRVVQKKRILNA